MRGLQRVALCALTTLTTGCGTVLLHGEKRIEVVWTTEAKGSAVSIAIDDGPWQDLTKQPPEASGYSFAEYECRQSNYQQGVHDSRVTFVTDAYHIDRLRIREERLDPQYEWGRGAPLTVPWIADEECETEFNWGLALGTLYVGGIWIVVDIITGAAFLNLEPLCEPKFRLEEEEAARRRRAYVEAEIAGARGAGGDEAMKSMRILDSCAEAANRDGFPDLAEPVAAAKAQVRPDYDRLVAAEQERQRKDRENRAKAGRLLENANLLCYRAGSDRMFAVVEFTNASATSMVTAPDTTWMVVYQDYQVTSKSIYFSVQGALYEGDATVIIEGTIDMASGAYSGSVTAYSHLGPQVVSATGRVQERLR